MGLGLIYIGVGAVNLYYACTRRFSTKADLIMITINGILLTIYGVCRVMFI